MKENDSVYKSACRMCHGSCGVLVHVREGKVVQLEGDPDSPLTRGKLCPKGLASIDHMYHPDRIKYPMKRLGERGEGKWERITWDEAYTILCSKIKDLRETSSIQGGYRGNFKDLEIAVREDIFNSVFLLNAQPE